MNPKNLFLILCMFFSTYIFSQKAAVDFYVFKSDWSPAKSLDDCTYFMQKIKVNDTEFVCRYYNKLGPMIKQETYKDDSLSVPNGRFCWYNEKGKIDSSGMVHNFKKDGEWDYFLGDSTKATFYVEYDNGRFVKRVNNSFADTSAAATDPTQKEATFPNGNKGWLKYLEKNLVVPERLKSLGRGNYTVTVCFLVSKEGGIKDLYLRKSVEWSGDAEVFEIFQKSPRWIPGIQKGQNVIYRQLQNITLAVQ